MSTTNLSFALTTAGRNRALTNTGIDLPITHIQLGDGHDTPDGSETALASPKETALISAAARIATGQWRFGAIVLGSGLNYGVSEIGLWSGDPSVVGSTLVFYWSMLTGEHGIKAPGIDYNVETDIYFGSVVPGNITIVADTQFNALSMLAQHNAHPDPHIGYLKESATQIVTINNFLRTPGIPPLYQYLENPLSVSNAVATEVIQTINIVTDLGAPAGVPLLLVRARLNNNGGNNVARTLYVRKNASAGWARKLDVDPFHQSIFGDGTEPEGFATFLVEVDTTTNTFDWKFEFNRTLVSVLLTSPTNITLQIEFELEGYYVPLQIYAVAP